MSVLLRKKRTIEFLMLLLMSFFVFQNLMSQDIHLEEKFRNPSMNDESAPWTFWYWMYGAVSKDGIKADLEAIKEIGLGGAYLMPIRSSTDNKSFEFYPAFNQLTPEWWKMVLYSMQEADRLNLKLGMHICDGFALAGGPWITPEKSMQKVVWSDTIIAGGKKQTLQLPHPPISEGFYKEIALYALPVSDFLVANSQVPKVISNTKDSFPNYLIDKSSSRSFKSSSPCWIQFNYDKPFTCRSLKIFPTGNNYQAQRFIVLASDDGIKFREIKHLIPPRQGWQNTDEPFTFVLPTTTARFFRFVWTPEGSEPGAEDLDAAKWAPVLKVNKIFLSSEPFIDQLEGKNGSIWRIGKRTSPEELSDQNCVKLSQIIRLDPSSIVENKLNVKLPSGMWRIVRIGHTSTGHKNETGGGGKGLECDKFSKDAVNLQLENWFGAVFKNTDSLFARRVLKFMNVESWESGSKNWSDNFL
jgi:hypothetical protein